MAKLLTAWSVAVAVALVGFLLNAVMANAAAWHLMHRIFFPNAMWLLLLAWVVPAVSGLGLGAMVLVSDRQRGGGASPATRRRADLGCDVLQRRRRASDWAGDPATQRRAAHVG